jgi:uncharacterized small protein (DUF1192 family)
LPAEDGQPEDFATAVTEVSERMSLLVREEVELAKAEVSVKINSILRGAAAIAAGAVFGVFALIFVLETIAWALNAIFISGAGDLWIGFLIVAGVLLLLTAVAGLFAWRKLRVGAPTPTMAIDEAKKIRETVAAKAQEES